MRRKLYLLATLTAGIALGACDDSVSGGTKPGDAEVCTGFGGCAVDTDAGGGTTGGTTGGTGGEAPPGADCLDDTQCEADEYCFKADGELEGECRSGCRADTCGAGRECNAEHDCVCTSDAGCEADQYCNLETGLCDTGCRPDNPASCPEGESCDAATRECIGQFTCCSADGMSCSLASDAASCEGTFIARLSTCEPNPCGPACSSDDECAADRFCSDERICITGCREAPNDNCPDGTHCDPEKNTCEPDMMDICEADEDCPDTQWCDVNTGVCEDGCRPGVAGECPLGEVCNADHACVPGCENDADCSPEQFCHPELGCQDFCDDNLDCQDDEFCDFDPAGGRCVEGCRDDADDGGDAGNDAFDSATPFVLANGHGEVLGRLVCPGDSDFYAVELFQQARMQVTLTATDPGIGDVKMRILDTDGVTVALQNIQPGSPKRLRFPEAAGMGVPAPGTYFVEVFSQDPVSQEYSVSITVIDASVDGGCFPDDAEFDNMGRGHNNAPDAVALDWDGGQDEVFPFRGSICGSDEDWFSFSSPSQDHGASIELVVDGLTGDAVIEMFDSANVRNLVPNYTSGPGVPGAGGTVTFRLDVPRDSAGLSEDTWYIRVRGTVQVPVSILDEYGLNINLLRSRVGCPVDAAEPNDGPAEVGPAADLDTFASISMRGALVRDQDLEVEVELSLCARDEDWFSFQANEGDQIRAWATSDTLAGEAIVEIAGGDGLPRGMPGNVVQTGQPVLPANYNGARDGLHYIRVRSVAAGTADPYVLFLRINPTEMCGADVAEVGPGGMRNDTFDTAVLLMSVDDASERYEYAGVVCNVDDPDLDWFRFQVPQADTRLCVAAEFADIDGDLSLDVFEGENNPLDDIPCGANRDCSDDMVRASRLCLPAGVCGCEDDSDCDVDADGLGPTDGRCVSNRCKSAIDRSTTSGSPEIVDFDRGTVGTGSKYILVSGADGSENSYNLNVTLNTRRPECNADWREGPGGNNQAGAAFFLGTGQGGVCDGWVCNDERGTGDWYSFDIGPDSHRTVIVTYQQFSDGQASLLFVAPDPSMGGMDGFFERPGGVPSDPRQECINVHSGDMGAHVFAAVLGGGEQPADGDSQIDYTLRILPYDPGVTPNGRCEEYIGNPTSVWEFDTL